MPERYVIRRLTAMDSRPRNDGPNGAHPAPFHDLIDLLNITGLHLP